MYLCVCAGYGGLALSIEGPSKVDIQTEDMEDGTCGVTYCPTEPGNYIVSIRFAEEHVPGKNQQCVLQIPLLVKNNDSQNNYRYGNLSQFFM